VPQKLPVKDVVVLLPGILGSVLQRDGKDVWAMNAGAIARGLFSRGRSVKSLAITDDDPDKPDLGDGVVATRLMPDVVLIPGFWKIDRYTHIRNVLDDRFELIEGKNWFDFPYDWRRDNRAAAQRLAEQAPKWLHAWREESGAADAKLVLLAHSMGGLVARAYLELYGGWQDTRALISFGTPYRGAVNALDYLANGFQGGFGPLKLDLSPLLRSLTSVYQLLPVAPCVDIGTGQLAKLTAISGLPEGVDPTRVAAAQAFHDDIAKSVDTNGPGRYDIHPVVGLFQDTKVSAVLRDGQITSLTTDPNGDDDGDSTVPRWSATPIELADQPVGTYATEKHGNLHNAAAVITQVAGILSWKKTGHKRASPFDGFKLTLNEVVPPDEPIPVRLDTKGPSDKVLVTVEHADTDKPAGRRTLKARADGSFRGNLRGLPPGVYRVAATDVSGAGLSPVHDLFVVAGTPDR
jgi:pimeloyl-ACP methyl ester carboxylesterase